MTKYQIAFMVLFGWSVWDNNTANEFGWFLSVYEGADWECDIVDIEGRLIVSNPNEELLNEFIQQDQDAFEETMRSIPAEAYERDIWL